MTLKRMPNLVLLLLLAAMPVAHAGPDDEATITVVDEGDTPDDVVKVIELPDQAGKAVKPAVRTDSSANS